MYTIEKDIVFGAIKPLDTPTIANYISTIKNWIRLQKTHSCIFTVSDLQLLHSNPRMKGIAEKSLDMLTLIISTGLEGERNNLYIQSNVPQHAELAWLLYGFVVNNGFTEDVDRILGNTSEQNKYLNLLSVSDYLLYQANIIPIGYNKEHYIDLAKLVVNKFNDTFGENFPAPSAFIDTHNSKVMGLQDVTMPMSRTTTKNEKDIIYITDSADTVFDRISNAIIESGQPFVFNKNNAGINNLLNIYKGITGKEEKEIERELSELSEREFREAIIEVINAEFQLIQMRYGLLKKNPDYIRTIMNSNASVSSYAASKTLDRIKNAVGIYYS